MMDLTTLREHPEILERIEWDLTPQEAVEMFDHRARGREDRLRVRDSAEKRYFFCVDNWLEKPRLVLKERSIKEARVVAEIRAPENLLSACVQSYGNRKGLFPLGQALMTWLMGRLFGPTESP
jgi:hypothetical protein